MNLQESYYQITILIVKHLRLFEFIFPPAE